MSTSTQSQTQSSNTVDQNQTNGSSSNAGDLSGVHPSAVGPHNMPDATKTQPPNDRSTDKDNVDQDHLDSQYPEQKHAGAVGYGPNYNQKAGFLDKVTGLKEEVKGKVTKNPDLAAKGHDRMTGELKHKELEEEDAKDAFANPEEKQAEAQGDSNAGNSDGTPGFTTAGTPGAGQKSASNASVPTKDTPSGTAAGTNNSSGTTTSTSGTENGTGGTTSSGTTSTQPPSSTQNASTTNA